MIGKKKKRKSGRPSASACRLEHSRKKKRFRPVFVDVVVALVMLERRVISADIIGSYLGVSGKVVRNWRRELPAFDAACSAVCAHDEQLLKQLLERRKEAPRQIDRIEALANGGALLASKRPIKKFKKPKPMTLKEKHERHQRFLEMDRIAERLFGAGIYTVKD